MNRVSDPDITLASGIDHTKRSPEDEAHQAEDTLMHTIPDRSEGMQEIISKNLGFTEKWALLVFLLILFVMLAIAWIVKYPDVVETDGVLTSANFPKEIVIVQGGRLKKLFSGNEEFIKNGEVIGWMESTADYQAVLKVKQQLDSCAKMLRQQRVHAAIYCFEEKAGNLGEIQKDYRDFIRSIELMKDYADAGYYSSRKKMLEADIRLIEEESVNLVYEKQLGEQDLKVAEETYKMNRQLFSDRVAAEEEFRRASSAFIAKQLVGQRHKASLISNKLRLNDKLKEIAQLSHDISQQQGIFEQALHTFGSVVEEWTRKYLLISPMDGRIAFVSPVQENQYFPKDKVVGFIKPVAEQQLFIDANLPQYNFGKIDTGMKVLLEFQAYPYQEFGYVNGTVAYISTVPSDSGFLATIRVNQRLVTNRGIVIPPKERLKVHARIVTKDMRLLERLYNSMVKSFKS